jgi:hypothetical protein
MGWLSLSQDSFFSFVATRSILSEATEKAEEKV